MPSSINEIGKEPYIEANVLKNNPFISKKSLPKKNQMNCDVVSHTRPAKQFVSHKKPETTNRF